MNNKKNNTSWGRMDFVGTKYDSSTHEIDVFEQEHLQTRKGDSKEVSLNEVSLSDAVVSKVAEVRILQSEPASKSSEVESAPDFGRALQKRRRGGHARTQSSFQDLSAIMAERDGEKSSTGSSSAPTLREEPAPPYRMSQSVPAVASQEWIEKSKMQVVCKEFLKRQALLSPRQEAAIFTCFSKMFATKCIDITTREDGLTFHVAARSLNDWARIYSIMNSSLFGVSGQKVIFSQFRVSAKMVTQKIAGEESKEVHYMFTLNGRETRLKDLDFLLDD